MALAWSTVWNRPTASAPTGILFVGREMPVVSRPPAWKLHNENSVPLDTGVDTHTHTQTQGAWTPTNVSVDKQHIVVRYHFEVPGLVSHLCRRRFDALYHQLPNPWT